MQFTSNWLAPHLPVWNRWLKPLAGRPLRALEIGSHEGRSAVWMLEQLLMHPQSTLMCVDLWCDPVIQRRFRANVAETGRATQVTEKVGLSNEVLRTLDGPFDLIYIDGSHEARDVLTDTVHAWRLLAPGGILIFDDYDWQGPVEFPPRPAIDLFLTLWMTRIEVLHKGGQIIVNRRVEHAVDGR